ncbi:unnamed protein product [Owenia fusiformis]|uniref:C2H2-type domain-containing protein n=1 Tax=Owenia fusiformis TaxID=6347 RepID=A0A8S4P0W4_OWEFU|nr:unnamed protein product [Owenia fusiformis]
MNNSDKLVFKCMGCPEEFSGFQQFKRHSYKLHKAVMKCKLCGDNFDSKAKYTYHVLRKHYNVSRLEMNFKVQPAHKRKDTPCSYCERVFRNSTVMGYHVKKCHTKEVQATCSTCKTEFFDVVSFKSHFLNNTKCAKSRPKKFRYIVCDLCGMMKSAPKALRSHMAWVHNREESKCDICHKLLKSKPALELHHQLKHNKTHLCTDCGMTFGTVHILRNHMRIHTGDKPFKCKTCDIAFTHGGSLSKHHQSKGHKEKAAKELASLQ